MRLDNNSLRPFIDKIRLHKDNMGKYRDQIENLKKKLEDKIKNDNRNGLKVTKFLLAGSWKKHTILRPTGDNPIDIDAEEQERQGNEEVPLSTSTKPKSTLPKKKPTPKKVQ